MPLRTAHAVDALWCDTDGVYVEGWAHAYDIPVTAIHLASGSNVVDVADRRERPDVNTHFPSLASTHSGFAAYLACPPFRPVTLRLATSKGAAEIDIAAPPTDPSGSVADPPAPLDLFVSAMKETGGVVVEIGARIVGQASTLLASRFHPECRHLGFDVHPAPGVDIVGDAHALGTFFEPDSVSGVLSLAVLEHLAAPWLVASEINRILAPGGLTLHLVPQTYPVHEMPNDFWRMTSEALKVLFGPSSGFEVVASGMADPVRIHMSPAWRKPPFLRMPFHPGMSSSYILARKVRSLPAGAIAWPMNLASLEALSQRYPVHGVTQAG